MKKVWIHNEKIVLLDPNLKQFIFLHIITLSPTVAPLFMKLENVLGDIERTSVSLNNFIGIRDCVITADFLNVN